MRISDWSSDVCSSDLAPALIAGPDDDRAVDEASGQRPLLHPVAQDHPARSEADAAADEPAQRPGARVAPRPLPQDSRRQQNADGHRPRGYEPAAGDAHGTEPVFTVYTTLAPHPRSPTQPPPE